MKNPCTQCIVNAMCKSQCEEFEDYVAGYISGHGYDIIYRENLFLIPKYLKISKCQGRTGNYTVYNITTGKYGTICVHYDSVGNILKLEEFNEKSV